jgi:hypothetical protein
MGDSKNLELFHLSLNNKATVYCINSSKYQIEEVMNIEPNDVDKDIIYYLMTTAPELMRISELSHHGDIIEDQYKNSYRGSSWFMVSKNPHFKVVELSSELDEYGGPSEEFKGITEFPLNYWNDMNCISLTGLNSQDYWHSDYPPIYCNVEEILKEASNIVELDDILKFLFRGIEYTIHGATVKSLKENGYVLGIQSNEGSLDW